jgi:hypothetical protein
VIRQNMTRLTSKSTAIEILQKSDQHPFER